MSIFAPACGIKTGRKCEACSGDYWEAKKGALVCRCGRWCWVERYREVVMVKGKPMTGTRFRYQQGEALPDGYAGCQQVTM